MADPKDPAPPESEIPDPPPFDPDPSLIGDMEKSERPPTDKRS